MLKGACVGVTTLGEFALKRSASRSLAISSQLMAKAGVKPPIYFYTLQAMVSQPFKPCLDVVVLHLGTGEIRQPIGQERDRLQRRSRPHSSSGSAARRRCSLETFLAFGQ